MNKKAIGLFSGGLDSILAAKVICDIGFDVEALFFSTVFQDRSSFDGLPENYFFSSKTKFNIRTIDINEKYLPMLVNPKFGYGKNINPCIDCKILFVREAFKIMKAENAEFVFTGEVLGQRPKSQRLPALNCISNETNAEGYLVRPLCAKLMTPTIPEIQGLINRENLYAFSGRSRKPQTELAQQLGVKNYGQPAGGCLLTIEYFTRKLNYLINNNLLTVSNIIKIKSGRFFALEDGSILVAGREESENKNIFDKADSDDIMLACEEIPGPTSIILPKQKITDKILLESAKITAYFYDNKENAPIEIRVFTKKNNNVKTITIEKPKDNKPISPF